MMSTGADDVIRVIADGDDKFLKEDLQNKQDLEFERQEREQMLVMLHYGKCRIQGFWLKVRIAHPLLL